MTRCLYRICYEKHGKVLKSNDGAPGVDGITIEEVEKYGVEIYLKELGEELTQTNVSTASSKTGNDTQSQRRGTSVRYSDCKG